MSGRPRKVLGWRTAAEGCGDVITAAGWSRPVLPAIALGAALGVAIEELSRKEPTS